MSWQSGSQQFAVIFAALVGLTLSATLRPEQMPGWGWRIPLLLGSMLIPFLFLLRRSLAETEEFLARKHRPGTARNLAHGAAQLAAGDPGDDAVHHHHRHVLSDHRVHADLRQQRAAPFHADSMLVTLFVGVSNFCLLPTMGALSDQVGRRPLLLLFSASPG